MTFDDALTRSRALFESGESAYRHGTALDVSGYPRGEQASYWLGVRSAHVYRPVAPRRLSDKAEYAARARGAM